MKDDLGKRMKENYEGRTKTFLPRRTYTLIRLDGKAFHTFTRGFKKPFDDDLINMMNETAKFLCKNIQGAVFAYVQSDEISILLTDFEKPETDAWFDGNVQKIVSVSASIATAKFNYLNVARLIRTGFEDTSWDKCITEPSYKRLNDKFAFFDSRVWTIPDPIEVENYFVWRQKDAVRNSIAMVAQSLYLHKELNGKSSNEQQEMIFQKGQNWNNIDDGKKRGRIICKTYKDPGRNEWSIISSFDFLKQRDLLTNLIPKYGSIICTTI